MNRQKTDVLRDKIERPLGPLQIDHLVLNQCPVESLGNCRVAGLFLDVVIDDVGSN